jgi:hypothetical protein
MCGDVTSTTSGVVQSPNFPGELWKELRSRHYRAGRMDDPIEIHHLQFGDGCGLCSRKKKKLNFSFRCGDFIRILFDILRLTMVLCIYRLQQAETPFLP